jgi:hypothetical protein
LKFLQQNSVHIERAEAASASAARRRKQHGSVADSRAEIQDLSSSAGTETSKAQVLHS